MISISIIGGSNSVLRDGYVSGLAQRLEADHGISVSDIRNASVGGTSTLTGLAALSRDRVHIGADVLIVEYTLNDSASFGRRPDLLDHWAKAYEGVVRKALAENPRIVVVPLILGRKGGPHRRGICWIGLAVRTIADRYGLRVADVTDALDGLPPEELAAYYADESHFSRDTGVELILTTLGQAIADSMGRRRDLPAPISPTNYAHARYLRFSEKHFRGQVERKVFQNSMFKTETLLMGAGSKLTFRISGQVLLFDYVSSRNSGTLRIASGAERFVQNTARATFLKGAYHFLVGTIIPEIHGRFSIRGNKTEIAIELTDDDRSGSADNADEAAAPLIAAMGDGPRQFATVGMLYCGSVNASVAKDDAAQALEFG